MRVRTKIGWLMTGSAMGLGLGLGAGALQAQPAATVAAHPSFEGVWEPKFDPAAIRTPPPPPVLTPAYQKVMAATKAKIAAGKLDINAMCSPPGLTFLIQSVGSLEIIDGPKPNLTILYEFQSQSQRVYLDGRPLPAEADPSPNGYSVGHWEGDTLVVDTKALSEFTYFDNQGIPHSPDLTLVTRIRRLDPQTLEMQAVATDPLVFAQPYTFTRRFTYAPTGTLINFECENMRNPVNPDGSLGYTFKSDEEIERDAAVRTKKKK